MPRDELHDLLADSSSCAVLALLMRILFTPDLVQGGPELAERVAQAALQWNDSEGAAHESVDEGVIADSQPLARNLFYSMAGDKSASHFLEVFYYEVFDMSPSLGWKILSSLSYAVSVLFRYRQWSNAATRRFCYY